MAIEKKPDLTTIDDENLPLTPSLTPPPKTANAVGTNPVRSLGVALNAAPVTSVLALRGGRPASRRSEFGPRKPVTWVTFTKQSETLDALVQSTGLKKTEVLERALAAAVAEYQRTGSLDGIDITLAQDSDQVTVKDA